MNLAPTEDLLTELTPDLLTRTELVPTMSIIPTTDPSIPIPDLVPTPLTTPIPVLAPTPWTIPIPDH